jgi:hypothetical protein
VAIKTAGNIKRVLRPERLRLIPAQFSWVDQALVQRHLIDRLEARAAALYLFLVTVADAQGLSYYGGRVLAQRLKLDPDELAAARAQLIGLDLIAYEAPLYQVLAVPGTAIAQRAQPATPPEPPSARHTAGLVRLGDLLEQWERRRDRL